MTLTQPVPWRVTLHQTETDEWDEVQVTAEERDEAEELATAPRQGWTATKAERLCVPCSAAPHKRCEASTELFVVDAERVPLGEEIEDHLVAVPMCPEHISAFQTFLRGQG